MAKMIIFCIFSFLISFAIGQEEESSTLFPPITWPEEALVEAGDLGKIQGALSYTSPNGKKFFWYADIPYADPASYTKGNRFKPSSLWTGPLPTTHEDSYLAVNFLKMCPQRDIFFKGGVDKTDLGSVMKAYKNSLKRESREEFRKNPRISGVEECLVLGVNTPKLPENPDSGDELMDVIFFIHGGSFDSIWGGIFGGHRFLNRDVVVVSINYRLGLLGSLNLGNDEAPGNAAMYDVITALKWVQKYIHFFGGNKDSVTVTGHSAGAVMASHLLTSPMMKDSNLFHKVIGLSGSSVSAWTTCTDPIYTYKNAASHAGCNQTDSLEIVDCLKDKNPEELIQALNRWEDDEKKEGRFGFDGKIPSIQYPELLSNTEIFMDDTPLNVFMRGEQKDIPVMMGATRHDGTFVAEMTYEDFLVPQNWLNDMVKMRNEFFPILLKGLGMEDTTGGAMIHSMAHTYLGTEAMNSDNFTDMIPGLIDVHSVIAFKAGAYNLLEMHAKKNPNAYYFAFDYSGFWTVDGGDVIPGGVGHIDSVFYLFQAFPLAVWPKDLQVSKRFVDYWVNFAKYGDPNGPEESDILFPPFNPDSHTFMIINGTDRIGYSCRDSWIDNSLEIMDPPSVVTEDPASTTNGASSTTEKSTTTGVPSTDETTEKSTTNGVPTTDETTEKSTTNGMPTTDETTEKSTTNGVSSTDKSTTEGNNAAVTKDANIWFMIILTTYLMVSAL